MPDIYIPADDFRVGDIVHLEDGGSTEVRTLHRGERGTISVNPGDFDEIIGYIWHHAHVTRADALTGHRPCPESHPTCGKCEACRWVIENGAYDEVTGKLSRPACTGPPPPVSLIKPHKCSGPLCCPPF